MEIHKLRKKKDKAEQDGNLVNLFFACKELADVYFRDENYNAALNEYKEMLRVSEVNNNKMDIARAHRMIGEVYSAKEEFDEAVNHQSIHLSLAREENDLVEEQRALATLGRTHFLRAEGNSSDDIVKRQALDEAKDFYLKSLSVCERLKDDQVGHKQKMEMRARLFLNLGLVDDSQGNFSAAVDNLSKAILICKTMDFWEDLYRNYSALASVHLRNGTTKEAISNCDLAICVASRLSDRDQLLCESLVCKAEALLELPDFRGARQALLKAYKLKPPTRQTKLDIENKLRIVAAICECEESLLELSQDANHEQRKNLYESIGDMASALGNYNLAVTYYHLMLDCVEKMAGGGKNLIDCYVSLAQTYLDQGNITKALEYFKKELSLERNCHVEAAKTCLNIADCLERLRRFDEMIQYYQQAKMYSNKASDQNLRSSVLHSMYNSLRLCGRTTFAENIRQQLGTSETCDESEEDESPEAAPSYGSHIIIEDLTDEDVADSEEFDRPKASTRSSRAKSNILKRNEKGETPLHTAAISGNKTLVLKLLQQGHSVDVKDYSGWTPLHEACNHGHTEVVELLLSHGSSVNDRGGPLCDGVTPLLDAASNGCLQVIDVLLSHNASPTMRTNKGESVVDCLTAWRQRYIIDTGSDLDPESLAHYNRLYKTLKEALEKAGQKVSLSPEFISQRPRSLESKSKPPDQSPPGDTIKPRKEPKGDEFGKRNQRSYSAEHAGLRRNMEDRRVSECKESWESGAANEYETAIKALRHRYFKHDSTVSGVARNSVPALLPEDETVGDEWLEEDLRPSKKRKTAIEHMSGFTTRNRHPAPHLLPDSEESEDSGMEEPTARNIIKPSTSGCSSNRLKVMNSSRRKQISLMTAGVTREKVRRLSEDSVAGASEESSGDEPMAPPECVPQPAAHALPLAQPPPAPTLSLPSTMSLKVRIEDKLFLIAIPGGRDDLTIGWLAQQAVRRYQKLAGMEPVLRLATDEGANLDDTDPLSLVVGCREVVGVVETWKMESLASRYAQVCQEAGTEVDASLSKRLEASQATGELSVENEYLREASLEPFLRTLFNQNSLLALNLSGNNLSGQIIHVIVECLVKLPLLETLDLTNTNIRAYSLNLLSQSVEKTRALQRLKCLKVSHNSLQGCIKPLSSLLLSLPALTCLTLADAALTPTDFSSCPRLSLGGLEWLDVSENEVGESGVEAIVSSLGPRSIRRLEMQRLGRDTVARVSHFLIEHSPPNLTYLNLAYCQPSDKDLQLLIKGIGECSRLEEVVLDGCSRASEATISSLLSLNVSLSMSGVDTPVDVTSRISSLTISSCSKQSLARPGPFALYTISL